jgi:hypothetical protein
MPIVQMPGGALEELKGKDLWWMRDAFDEEWKGAVMLRLGDGNRIYSIEALEALASKFKAENTPLAKFTPPEGKMDIFVNADAVDKVETANPAIHHEKAKAVLRFTRKIKLAVRETEEAAKAKLKAARAAAKS